MRRRVGTLAYLLTLTYSVAAGQVQDEHLTLEVASVKLSTGANVGPPNSNGGPGTKYPEWFGTDTTLRGLISMAYGLVNAEGQVSGPGWIDSQKYAVEAKVAPKTTKAQFQQMLQNLLAERFQLVVHHETTLLSVYELVVANNGSKLKESRTTAGDASSPSPLSRGAFADSDRDGFPVLTSPGLISRFGPGTASHLTAREQPISNLVRMLSGTNAAARTVIDKTGLAGKYDFTLHYEFQMPGASVAGESSEPGLFEAIQQQLGLKLVSAKASFDRVVIDHAEKMPTAN
jgi:uncharacterized protein (TIGR03435 family)